MEQWTAGHIMLRLLHNCPVTGRTLTSPGTRNTDCTSLCPAQHQYNSSRQKAPRNIPDYRIVVCILDILERGEAGQKASCAQP